jgi:uncharacterized protein
MIDYSLLDQPFLLQFIFYPRKAFTSCPPNSFDFSVEVDDSVSVACRFYVGQADWPWILFFHGNGEVVSDYDGIAPLFHKKNLNLAVADYRGYGASGGIPTLGNLVKDASVIFEKVKKELGQKGYQDDLWVMGRSLGSIAALEIAYRHQDELKGIIIESGFPSVVRIMTRLGMPAGFMDLEKIDQACLQQIEKIKIPALIIHGERDSLVPLQNAKDLFEHLGTEQKELMVVASAEHNDIMEVGLDKYFESLRRFVGRTSRPGF